MYYAFAKNMLIPSASVNLLIMIIIKFLPEMSNFLAFYHHTFYPFFSFDITQSLFTKYVIIY